MQADLTPLSDSTSSIEVTAGTAMPNRCMSPAAVCLTLLLLVPRACQAEFPHAADKDSIARNALQQGVAWLLAQQAEDGGWHSRTYGNLSGGFGNTALVLAALSQLPEDLYSRTDVAFRRGVTFLSARMDARQLVGGPVTEGDYPVYATALLLTALKRDQKTEWSALKEHLTSGLIGAQRTIRTGWSPDHPDFGGWGHATGGPQESGNDPSTISLTAHVLEALSSNRRLSAQVRADAMTFVVRCQPEFSDPSENGGFLFASRRDDLLNKLRASQPGPASATALPYVTATSDGLIALTACGLPADDTRLKSAWAWIDRRTLSADRSDPAISRLLPGFEFYAVARLSRINDQSESPGLHNLRDHLIQELFTQQLQDGSWCNPSTEMREDDPLIATSFMVLAICRTAQPE